MDERRAESTRGEVTSVLQAIRGGAPDASARLLPLVYEELRGIARARMAALPRGRTLQPTALVHEAYMRLVDADGGLRGWDSRAHFFGAAASAMRNILVDAARRRQALKRGGDAPRERVAMEDAVAVVDAPVDDLLALDDALTALRQHDERAHEIVMLRCFAGLGEEEVAQVLGLSGRSVRRDWAHARAWLGRAMDSRDGAAPGGSAAS